MASSQKSNIAGHISRRRIKFTIEKDIILLKCSLQHNPWQLGEDKWKDISTELTDYYKHKITIRTIKDRLKLLLEKFSAQELSSKTGTEDMKTEREELLKVILDICEDNQAPIYHEMDLSFPQLEYQKEKMVADREIKKLLETSIASDDYSPETDRSCSKRLKLSPEDGLVKQRQDHEIAMDLKRIGLEREKLQKDNTIEEKRLAMEQSRLELEIRREARLAEESKRRDELELQRETRLAEESKRRDELELQREIRLAEESKRKDLLAESQVEMQKQLIQALSQSRK